MESPKLLFACVEFTQWNIWALSCAVWMEGTDSCAVRCARGSVKEPNYHRFNDKRSAALGPPKLRGVRGCS